MEELVKFYETVLIPHLKNKYGELMVLAAEMEATIVFKENKINKLEDKLNLLNRKGEGRGQGPRPLYWHGDAVRPPLGQPRGQVVR
jgi:hypothetical protein